MRLQLVSFMEPNGCNRTCNIDCASLLPLRTKASLFFPVTTLYKTDNLRRIAGRIKIGCTFLYFAEGWYSIFYYNILNHNTFLDLSERNFKYPRSTAKSNVHLPFPQPKKTGKFVPCSSQTLERSSGHLMRMRVAATMYQVGWNASKTYLANIIYLFLPTLATINYRFLPKVSQ